MWPASQRFREVVAGSRHAAGGSVRLRAGRYRTWRTGIGLPCVYRDAGTGRVMGVFATLYGRAFYVEWWWPR